MNSVSEFSIILSRKFDFDIVAVIVGNYCYSRIATNLNEPFLFELFGFLLLLLFVGNDRTFSNGAVETFQMPDETFMHLF